MGRRHINDHIPCERVPAYVTDLRHSGCRNGGAGVGQGYLTDELGREKGAEDAAASVPRCVAADEDRGG